MRPFLIAYISLGLVACYGQEFLPRDQRDFSSITPPPPSDDSLAGLADLNTLLQLQNDRTPAQVARARRVSDQTPFSFARPVLGEWFAAEKMPRTAAIFKKIDREKTPIVDQAKRIAHRPRPYLRDYRIKPAVPKPPDDSYPSGHAAEAAIWAEVLSAAFPEHTAEFQIQVQETMWGRELGGVHYPTDTVSGVMLGKAIAKEMLDSSAMEKALGEIREEAAAARKHSPQKAPVLQAAESSK